MEQKRLVISRHGECPQKPEGGSEDFLYDNSVESLYEKGRGELNQVLVQNGVFPWNVRLDHSEAERTRDTGMAYLAGAFGVLPIPKTVKQLRDIPKNSLCNLDRLVVVEDPRLGIGQGGDRMKFNMDLVKEWGADGNHNRYLDFWASQPDATELEGQPVTPFNRMIDVGKSYLVDALGYLLKDEADVVFTATHGGGIAEPIVMAAIGARLPSDIGGAFGMEENAQIILERNSAGYKARIDRGELSYAVDLDSLRR